MLSTLLSTAALTGCATTKQVVVIPSDEAVVAMTHGKPYTPAVDGWFVPNARMLKILNALDKTRIQNK